MNAVIVLLHKNCIYHFNAPSDGVCVFGSGKKDDVYVEDLKPRHIVVSVDKDTFIVDSRSTYGVLTNSIPFDSFLVLDKADRTLVFVSEAHSITSDTELRLPYNCSYKVGRADTNDIVLKFPFVSSEHFILRSEQGIVRVEDRDSTNGLFLNGKKVGIARMRSGDVLSVMSIRIYLNNGVLRFENVGNNLKFNLFSEKSSVTASRLSDGSGRLLYRRSPRAQEKLPSEDIVLANAPTKAQKYEKGRGALTSLVGSGAMMAGSLIAGAISPALLAARAASFVSPVVNAASGGSANKKRKKSLERYEAMRQEKYGAYIMAQKARIESVASLQRDIISRENPSPSECMKITGELRRNLWERSPQDKDFLDVRLGMGYEQLCVNVKANQDSAGFSMEDDEVRDLTDQIIEETRIVDNVPVRVRLGSDTSVGIVGPRPQETALVRNMIVSLCTAHCADEVRIVGIFDEEERGEWESLRWLPHVWDEDKKYRMLFFGEREAAAGISYLSELIHNRNLALSDNKDGDIPLPRYILLLGSRKLTDGTELMRRIFESDRNNGISSVFIFDEVYNLPHRCGFIVELSESPCAYDRMEINNRFFFTPDDPVSDEEFDSFARTMSAVELDEAARQAPIPKSITFLEGYGVKTVEELNAASRWASSRPYETLAAPIGAMEGGKVFSLDIHEKMHGPHGLVAGTTGSGKSELLQTWILSMAVNYHPYDVAFVLIDYKGGGMANMLEPLPHVVGKITNIESSISRSMTSLQSEIKRRLRLFDLAGVNHIDKYQKLYRNGSVKEPLPHLIIVTDEFAELKKEEPDFMSALISASRVGRSLGIHLVLATQKPGGIVDDQIQSNSRFRLCLKVQDAADSREMIKRPDAARLTNPGRSYIRVGEDEVFDLFQSYWSGAAYAPEADTEPEITVPVVQLNGERIELFAGPEKKNDSGIDELKAVTEYIADVAEKAGIRKLPGPWLPELPDRLPLDALQSETEKPSWPKLPIGMFDIPELQAQGIQYIDFAEEGHYAIYGAPGTGKTTLLKTILMGIGRLYRPDEVCVYVLDAGGWSLSVFSELPNVGSVVLDREEEKVDKLQQLIMNEFDRRRKLFLKNSVSSLKAYRRDISPDLPAIVLLVDNIVPLFDLYQDIETFFATIARDGATYGIYLVFTSNSTSGVRYRVIQNVRGAVAFELTDSSDYTNLVGRPQTPLGKICGRAYIKGNPPTVFQAALPFDSESDYDMTEMIKAGCRRLRNEWRGTIPPAVPVMPDVVSEDQIWSSVRNAAAVAAGICYDDMTPAVFDLSEKYNLLIAGPSGSGKSGLLRSAARHIKDIAPDSRIMVFAADEASFKSSAADSVISQDDDAAVSAAVAEIISGLKARQSGGSAKTAPLVIIIDDLKSFVDAVSDENRDAMERICRLSSGLGVMVLCAGRTEDMSLYSQIEPLTRTVIASGNGLGIEESPSRFMYYPNGLGFQEASAAAGEGNAFMFAGGRCSKIKLPVLK